jgi:hypothetical protein
MLRTTILMDDDLMLRMKRIAHTRGVTLTEVIKDAVTAYIESQPQSGLPSFTATAGGKGEGRSNTARNAKRLVRRAVDPYEGSPHEGKR